MFYSLILNMRKFSLLISSALLVFVWFTYAANPSIINHSYSVDGNNVTIFRTNNSNGWNVDINVQDPTTKDWMHYGTVAISEEHFNYVKQWNWDQPIWMIPDDGWDELRFTIPSNTQWAATVAPAPVTTQETAVRTVIPVAPKTWPNGHLIGIICATLVIFGWYIYLKKRADI